MHPELLDYCAWDADPTGVRALCPSPRGAQFAPGSEPGAARYMQSWLDKIRRCLGL
jgi:hypothetical protein